MSALAPTLQAFFTDRLIRQRHASSHTIAAYRDTLRLLLGYASDQSSLAPSALDLADLDAPLIAGFLDHLERERGNSVRTRNARLAAPGCWAGRTAGTAPRPPVSGHNPTRPVLDPSPRR